MRSSILLLAFLLVGCAVPVVEHIEQTTEPVNTLYTYRVNVENKGISQVYMVDYVRTDVNEGYMLSGSYDGLREEYVVDVDFTCINYTLYDGNLVSARGCEEQLLFPPAIDFDTDIAFAFEDISVAQQGYYEEVRYVTHQLYDVPLVADFRREIGARTYTLMSIQNG